LECSSYYSSCIIWSVNTRYHMGSDIFFFQAEDGIRYATVTGVQTCALRADARAAAEVPPGRRPLAAAQLPGLARARGRVGQVLPQGPAVLPLRAHRAGRLRRRRVRRPQGPAQGHEADRHGRACGEGALQHREGAGVDRVRLDPATPGHARARLRRPGPRVGAPRHGRGAPPRLPDGPPHHERGLVRRERREGRRYGRAHPLVADRLAPMAAMQKAANKWFSRGLEMFGFEKEPFSSAQVNLGLKDRTNADAQQQWIDECAQMLGDLSRRYVRARLPGKTPEEIDAIQQRLAAGETVEGIAPEEMLRLPDRRFFRRSFDGAYEMVGIGGETFADVDAYVAHLAEHLPEAYLASRDMRHYIENLRKVVAGEATVKQAVKNTPKLQRLGSTCPCSNSVRWVIDTDVARLRPQAHDERAPRLLP